MLNFASRRSAAAPARPLGLLTTAAAFLAVAAAAGCNSNNANNAGGGGDTSTAPTTNTATTSTNTSGGGGGGKNLRLAFVCNNASDFWTIARKGVDKAKSELPNADVQFVIPDEGTAANQRQKVDDLLVKGLDGMAISPVDPQNQTDMLNAAASKALIFTQDSDAPGSQRACYVGTDNVAAGRQAGELVKAALPQGGKIMLFVGKRDAQNAKEREQGIRDALKGSNVQVVDVRTDDTDRARAKQNVADTLAARQDINGLVGLWSYNGPAILSAVKEGGKTGKVKIVCFDEEADTLAGVKDGSIYATVVQQPYQFGYQSITLLAKTLNGDKSAIPASKKLIVPTRAIKQADVDAFKTELDKLRGRA